MNIKTKQIVLLMIILPIIFLSVISMFSAGKEVKVSSISDSARCGNLEVGDTITQAGGSYIENKGDFNKILESVSKGQYVPMIVNGGPGGCRAVESGDLGIDVSESDSGGLNFGTNIAGGKKVKITLSNYEEQVDQVSEIFERRMSVLGVSDYRIDHEDDAIMLYIPTEISLESLMMEGNLKGCIQQEIKIDNGSGTIKLDESEYVFESDDSRVVVEGEEYNENESFVVDDVPVEITNITNNSVVFDYVIFQNEDVEIIENSNSYVTYDEASRKYYFNVPVALSESSSERFSKVTDNLLPIYQYGGGVLDGSLVYYLDGKILNKLNIPLDMGDQKIETISIIGVSDSESKTIDMKSGVEMSMAGKMPDNIVVESVSRFEGSLEWIVLPIMVSITLVLIATSAVTYIQYKTKTVSAYATALLLSEIIFIFGIASTSQRLMNMGWVIDIYSLMGMVVFTIQSSVYYIITQKRVKKLASKYNKIRIGVYTISFILLFTKLNGMGMIIMNGGAISLITKSIYSDIIKKAL